MRIKMSLIAHERQNSDGSYSVWLYNNKEELNAVFAVNSDDDDEPLTYNVIAEEGNPYENGYVTNVEFTLDINVETNTANLVAPVFMSVG